MTVPIGANPYQHYGWRQPTAPEPDEHTPVVLVCGTRIPDLRQVRHELTRAWRRTGQPITVCVSLWEARSPVGREAHAWTVEHRFAGVCWHPATTCPGPVVEALMFGPPRQPAAGWIPEAAA